MKEKKIIPYGRQSIDESDAQAVMAALHSDLMTTGPYVTKFEDALCELTGARYAVACSNATTGLHLACSAFGMDHTKLGVTSPITFLASANCLEYCGSQTDFIDIDPESLCMSPRALRDYYSSHRAPDVVIPVHFAGLASDMPSIAEIASRHHSVVIEDAAHAIGSTYTSDNKQIPIGSCAHSDATVFSFHPVKTITTGEGGAVLTNDEVAARRLRKLRSHGMSHASELGDKAHGPWYYEMSEVGYNYRITDLQCALGVSQLSRLSSFKKRRREIYDRYNQELQNDARFILPSLAKGQDPSFHLYVLQLTSGSSARLNLYTALREEGIYTQIHYIPVHLQPYYKAKYGYNNGKCPVAERYYEGCISLPLYAGISDTDVTRVIEAVLRLST